MTGLSSGQPKRRDLTQQTGRDLTKPGVGEDDSGGTRRAASLCLLWLWVSGCEATGLPRGAQRFTAPAQYRAWWALTEACSRRRGDFNTVTWYIVPNTDVFPLEGQSVYGAWYGDPNRIVLGDSERTDGSLVRHEMLHALLQTGGHPRNQFLDGCGDIVACVDQCVIDGGGPPDTSDTAPIVGPALLPAAILLAPDTVSMSADSGWTTITLTLTNHHPPARARRGSRRFSRCRGARFYGTQAR